MVERALLPSKAFRFGLVGLGGTVVNTILLTLLYGRLHAPLQISTALAAEVAVIHNFLWNDNWTFGGAGRPLRRLLRHRTRPYLLFPHCEQRSLPN